VSALMPRLPLTMSLTRAGETPISYGAVPNIDRG
jgi:hypothetical protein